MFASPATCVGTWSHFGVVSSTFIRPLSCRKHDGSPTFVVFSCYEVTVVTRPEFFDQFPRLSVKTENSTWIQGNLENLCVTAVIDMSILTFNRNALVVAISHNFRFKHPNYSNLTEVLFACFLFRFYGTLFQVILQNSMHTVLVTGASGPEF